MSHIPAIDTAKETGKITGFITKVFSDANKTTGIVAVSGGIDSAITLFLSTKSLGPKNIIALHLPTKTTNPLHTQHVEKLIKVAKIRPENFITININSIVQKSWRIIKSYSPNQPDQDNKLRVANLTSRIRMLVLYDQAKKHDALVIGTENFSEHLLGYYTRFGDEASDLEPIKHLYKTQLIELAKHLGVPKDIVNKKPSADLWQGQTDANELGFKYQQADPILYLHHQGKSKTDIIKSGFTEKLVKQVISKVESNTFKHQVPYSLLNH